MQILRPVLRAVPEQLVATATGPAESYYDGPQPFLSLWKLIRTHLHRYHITPIGPDLAAWSDTFGEPLAFTVDLHTPIPHSIPSNDIIVIHTLPALPLVATLQLRGPYSDLPAAQDALNTWLDRHGLERHGPFRELYLAYALHDCDKLTELQVPVHWKVPH